MTFTVAPRNAWTAGYFDTADSAVYLAEGSQFFTTPQAVLDHACSEEGRNLQFGPCGLVFVHVCRSNVKTVTHYFQSLAAANRFHKRLSKPA